MKLDPIDQGPLRVLRDVLKAVESDHLHFGPSVREIRRAIDKGLADANGLKVFLAASSALPAAGSSDGQDAERLPSSAVPEKAAEIFDVAAALEAGRRERDAEMAELRRQRGVFSSACKEQDAELNETINQLADTQKDLARVTADWNAAAEALHELEQTVCDEAGCSNRGSCWDGDLGFCADHCRGEGPHGREHVALLNLARVTAERDEIKDLANEDAIASANAYERVEREHDAVAQQLQEIAEILDHEGDSPVAGVRNLIQDLHDTCRERDAALVTKCGAHPGGRTTCGKCFTNLEIELLDARSALAEAQAELSVIKEDRLPAPTFASGVCHDWGNGDTKGLKGAGPFVCRRCGAERMPDGTVKGDDTKCLTIREAARRRLTLEGPSAQALEGALAQAERELSAIKAERGEWADGQAALFGQLAEAQAEVANLKAVNRYQRGYRDGQESERVKTEDLCACSLTDPCIAGTRIPTWVIDGRFIAGETIAEIAADMEIATAQVEDALRFHWPRRRVATKRKLKEAGL